MRIVGAISVCYICAEMLNETKNKTVAAEDLNSLLGIPISSSNSTTKGQDKGMKNSKIDYNHHHYDHIQLKPVLNVDNNYIYTV